VHLRELPGHLCVGRNGSAVIVGGEVKGSTDFIYGFGISYFENTTLASRGVSGGLVAWKGYTEFYGPDTFGASSTIRRSSSRHTRKPRSTPLGSVPSLGRGTTSLV
jgi:hypothetical protein